MKLKLILILGFFLFLVACATKAQLYLKADGTYSAIALSKYEKDARKAVVNRAERTCNMLKQSVVVLDDDVEYRRVPVKKASSTKLFDWILDPSSTGDMITLHEDYKATLKFSCEEAILYTHYEQTTSPG